MSKKYTSLILILDHNMNSANILAKRLGGMGYKSEVFATWKSVIDYLNAEKSVIPDLILVDIANPSDDLMNLPKLISDMTIWGKTIPIAVHSGISEKAYIVEAIQAGYVDYLVRPVEAEIFTDRVEKLIHRTPVLNDTTFRKDIHVEAQLMVRVVVTQINEFGFLAQTTARLPTDTVFEVSAEVFQQMGIEYVSVRASDARIIGHNQYVIHFGYVGIEPHDLREIRRYVLKSVA